MVRDEVKHRPRHEGAEPAHPNIGGLGWISVICHTKALFQILICMADDHRIMDTVILFRYDETMPCVVILSEDETLAFYRSRNPKGKRLAVWISQRTELRL